MAILTKATSDQILHLRYIQSITSEFLGAWSEAFVTSTEELKSDVTTAALEEALTSGNVAALTQGMPWDQAQSELVRGWRPLLAGIVDRAGAAELARLKLGIRFDLDNPFVQRVIDEHVANLVTNVTDETKDAIRAVVSQGFEQGHPPRRMAMRIREMVGLTERDALAVERYWRTLTEEADLNARRVDALTDTYSRRKIRERAVVVARTETVNAANNGQQQSWLQARDEGFLLPETRREWTAALESPRTCPICRELDGQRVGIDEPFYSSILGRHIMNPTAHPRCRCSSFLFTPVPED